jgi:hypothetical protein
LRWCNEIASKKNSFGKKVFSLFLFKYFMIFRLKLTTTEKLLMQNLKHLDAVLLLHPAHWLPKWLKANR